MYLSKKLSQVAADSVVAMLDSVVSQDTAAGWLYMVADWKRTAGAGARFPNTVEPRGSECFENVVVLPRTDVVVAVVAARPLKGCNYSSSSAAAVVAVVAAVVVAAAGGFVAAAAGRVNSKHGTGYGGLERFWFAVV